MQYMHHTGTLHYTAKHNHNIIDLAQQIRIVHMRPKYRGNMWQRLMTSQETPLLYTIENHMGNNNVKLSSFFIVFKFVWMSTCVMCMCNIIWLLQIYTIWNCQHCIYKYMIFNYELRYVLFSIARTHRREALYISSHMHFSHKKLWDDILPCTISRLWLCSLVVLQPLHFFLNWVPVYACNDYKIQVENCRSGCSDNKIFSVLHTGCPESQGQYSQRWSTSWLNLCFF